MKRSFFLVFFAVVFGLNFDASAQAPTSWEADVAVLSCPIKMTPNVTPQIIGNVFNAVKSGFSGFNVRIARQTFMPRKYCKGSVANRLIGILKWRWGKGSRGKARFLIFYKIERKAQGPKNTIKVHLYAWDVSKVVSGQVMVPTRLGYTGIIYSGGSYADARAAFKRNIAHKSKQSLNLLLFNHYMYSKTRCAKHSDCGNRMILCKAGRCVKKSSSDVVRRQGHSGVRFCENGNQCYSDEVCVDRVCRKKLSGAQKKCKPDTFTCGGSTSYKCSSDGSRWLHSENCSSRGCDTSTGRCKPRQIEVARVARPPERRVTEPVRLPPRRRVWQNRRRPPPRRRVAANPKKFTVGFRGSVGAMWFYDSYSVGRHTIHLSLEAGIRLGIVSFAVFYAPGIYNSWTDQDVYQDVLGAGFLIHIFPYLRAGLLWALQTQRKSDSDEIFGKTTRYNTGVFLDVRGRLPFASKEDGLGIELVAQWGFLSWRIRPNMVKPKLTQILSLGLRVGF
ncbi:hypothetical protein KKH43_02205 [Patescibacteria group bacterium]|nr:hypothetical protein [Patescibacteria group bacterium]